MEHLTDETLDAYCFDPAGATDRSAVEAHVRTCNPCGRRLKTMTAFVDALRRPETWQNAQGLSGRGSRGEAHAGFAERLDAEDRAAERLLRPILDAPSFDMPRQRTFSTGGVVRLLSSEAHTACETAPLRARALADAATTIADALPDDDYPRRATFDLRGLAWKERANANRYLGNLPEALGDLQRAEGAFKRGPAPALGIGIVLYIRALVLRDQDNLDAALSDARASAEAFRELKLAPRAMNARLVEGMVLYQAGRFAEARGVFAELLAVGETGDDAASIARTSLNLANCDIELGNHAEAATGLRRARALFVHLGLHTEVLRVDGSEGLLLLATGQRAEGIRELDRVSRAFAGSGMNLQAALLALYALEARLADGKSEELLAVAQALVKMFMAAGRISGALAALAYVKDLAANQRLTQSALVYVRAFLSRSERRPELAFAPPPV